MYSRVKQTNKLKQSFKKHKRNLIALIINDKRKKRKQKIVTLLLLPRTLYSIDENMKTKTYKTLNVTAVHGLTKLLRILSVGKW